MIGFDPLSAPLLMVAAPFVGSFCGLVFDRMPRGESVLLGRSRCNRCRQRVALFDLVPVFGWLRLCGRCRNCRAAIGLAPLGFEMSAPVIAVWTLSTLPPGLAGIGFCLGQALVLLAAMDLAYLRLPDCLTLSLLPAGLIVNGLFHQSLFADALIGATAGFCALYLVATLYRFVRRRSGLGQGDIKLIAAAGAWIGWQGLPLVLLVATTGGLIFAVALSIRGERNIMRRAVPFGPFLALGFWLVWLYRPGLVRIADLSDGAVG